MKVDVQHIDKSENEHASFYIHEQNNFYSQVIEKLQQYGNQSILLKDKQKNIMRSVAVDTIFYVEYVDRLCFFYLAEKIYEKRITLKKLKEELPNSFVQISQTMLVNIYGIQEISSSLLRGDLIIKLRNGEQVSVSRYFSKSFKEQISSHYEQM